ncbi:MAG: hypothetical protein P8Q97_19275 [Myxococcota bacterium]|jgi:hypothetical protein|nr:hypothetical protein [Myxococcota bacterium]
MTFFAKVGGAIESWLYELNEKKHWFFRLLEWGNDRYAAVFFRGIRRRAMTFDEVVPGRDRLYQMRFLRPEDEGIVADLFGRFDFKYLPPHSMESRDVGRILRRPSYLPFGLFRDEKLTGYYLIRLLAPRNCFTGVWSFPTPENVGLSRAAGKFGGSLTDREGIIDFVTVPLDNHASMKAAEFGGWERQRANRRFYLLRRPLPPRLFPFARFNAKAKNNPDS